MRCLLPLLLLLHPPSPQSCTCMTRRRTTCPSMPRSQRPSSRCSARSSPTRPKPLTRLNAQNPATKVGAVGAVQEPLSWPLLHSASWLVVGALQCVAGGFQQCSSSSFAGSASIAQPAGCMQLPGARGAAVRAARREGPCGPLPVSANSCCDPSRCYLLGQAAVFVRAPCCEGIILCASGWCSVAAELSAAPCAEAAGPWLAANELRELVGALL